MTDLFDGLFDFNGDGITDSREEALGFAMFEEIEKDDDEIDDEIDNEINDEIDDFCEF